MKTLEIILASQSPRRKEILEKSGFEFSTISLNADESFPSDMPAKEVAKYLAEKKALAFKGNLENKILITSDTIVICDNKVLGKPKDKNEAKQMLKSLSNNTNLVITGVCIKTNDETITFDDTTEVIFRSLNDSEIDHYIDKYKPYDKAGAYGIQEWIGMIGIERINGSYYNVMGLPSHKVYEVIKKKQDQKFS
ncbi:Maf family nucleotide pyrophosphatase [Aureibacter tunicatorum]|uniref:dTTP/UTP pyrophosphatase n=1 Tax=Aureibacter tunicatorum TaxID=866807 RepID=A0AAE3XM54_9BACT|nr:Maf family nucleotide pyrophosphatase [Aureibacter tunicatorum]MDR6238972.1 septum formation protein [Aureibacter tunicatorum]BDD05102.1 Maf-like protein [Aureibacter tunicatorum]